MAPKLILPPRTPRLPLVLQRRSTEEYTPLPVRSAESSDCSAVAGRRA